MKNILAIHPTNVDPPRTRYRTCGRAFGNSDTPDRCCGPIILAAPPLLSNQHEWCHRRISSKWILKSTVLGASHRLKEHKNPHLHPCYRSTTILAATTYLLFLEAMRSRWTQELHIRPNATTSICGPLRGNTLLLRRWRGYQYRRPPCRRECPANAQ